MVSVEWSLSEHRFCYYFGNLSELPIHGFGVFRSGASCIPSLGVEALGLSGLVKVSKGWLRRLRMSRLELVSSKQKRSYWTVKPLILRAQTPQQT